MTAETPKKQASEAYLAKLRDPRWQKMRLEIMQRDGFSCQFCSDEKSTLHIHHLQYVRGKEPWEYSPEYLVTLCEFCHEREQERPALERQLLDFLKMAKISVGDLQCVAMPMPFGTAHTRKIFDILMVLMNGDHYKPENVAYWLDELKSLHAEYYGKRF